jgi:mannose-6-phosphate isomerase-like protein (cupin superfamily)
MHFDPAGEPLQQPRVMHLDDFQRLAGPGSLTWIPVRHTLDVRAFGTNAYEAERIGQDVVEPHTESLELGHQELYYVARGHVRFILDGHEHDAPAGTYVFVPDPRSHRHAVAEEEGTVVLSFGGPPTFEPSLWETVFRASAIAETNPAAARELMAEAIAARPDDAKVCYNAACLEARIGDVARTCELLARAIELEPKCAKWASADEDFAGVADTDEFRALVDG